MQTIPAAIVQTMACWAMLRVGAEFYLKPRRGFCQGGKFAVRMVTFDGTYSEYWSCLTRYTDVHSIWVSAREHNAIVALYDLNVMIVASACCFIFIDEWYRALCATLTVPDTCTGLIAKSTSCVILGKMNAALTTMPNPKPITIPTASPTIHMFLFLREFSGIATGWVICCPDNEVYNTILRLSCLLQLAYCLIDLARRLYQFLIRQ